MGVKLHEWRQGLKAVIKWGLRVQWGRLFPSPQGVLSRIQSMDDEKKVL